VGSLLTFDIPQTALVAALDTYDFILSSLSKSQKHIHDFFPTHAPLCFHL
jgi:hypothetical protein